MIEDFKSMIGTKLDGTALLAVSPAVVRDEAQMGVGHLKLAALLPSRAGEPRESEQ